VQFLKACSVEVRESILNKAPAEMAADLKDGINLSENVSKETYLSVERKLLNRMKVLANNGQFNIAAINERIFTEEFGFQNQASEIASVDMRRVG
jgi:hypothetical protein